MDLPPEAMDTIKGVGYATFWSLVGRVIAHARAVQLGHRRVFALSLLWELPIALGMARTGQAVAEWTGLTSPNLRDAIIITVAYVGPRIFEMLFQRGSDILKKVTA